MPDNSADFPGFDPAIAISLLVELRNLTEDERGAQRVAWSETWRHARSWFESKFRGLPVEQHRDAAGNNWFTLKGASEKALILGGHLDSVPNGGWLDGALGVMAAYAVLLHFARSTELPPLTLRLVDWADEEGARFGRSLFGSSAFAGKASIDADRLRHDQDGQSLESVLAENGIDIDRISEATLEQVNACAYLELHIEQGPVLERLDFPLGVVLGTKGVERHAIVFLGQEAHSGSTPMTQRKDALAAAAKLALEIRNIAGKHVDAVCTMGSLKTFPGIVTAVVGRAEATLDQRDLDAITLAEMYAEAQSASTRFALEEGCTVEWSRIWSIEPIPFHPGLIKLCEQAVLDTCGNAYRLPSGPLHDAAEVSRAGIPTTMLFVRSLGGISHNKIEDSKKEDLLMAVQALHRLTLLTMTWVLDQ